MGVLLVAFFIFKSLTTNQLKAEDCPVSHGAFYPLSVFYHSEVEDLPSLAESLRETARTGIRD
jgi:hypothetical protein